MTQKFIKFTFLTPDGLEIYSNGKSTLQKMLVEDAFKRGHRVAAFDPSGEYAGVSKYSDGISVKLNGEDGLINPFHRQVFLVTKNFRKSRSRLL